MFKRKRKSSSNLQKFYNEGSIKGLSSIEGFLFEVNLAHDLVSLIKDFGSLIMNLEDCRKISSSLRIAL